MGRSRGAITILALALLAGCGGAGRTTSQPVAPAASLLTSSAAPRPTRHHHQPQHPARAHVAAKPTHLSTPSPTPTHAPQSRPSLLVDRLVNVGDARQVVAVTATGYGTSYAQLRTFQRNGHGWREVSGPWSARIGYNGFAPSGHKREGDGRTPSGSFGFQYMFGVNANPGVRYAYRRALRTSWWDDDSASRSYNLWVDSRTGDAGRSPESMHQVPAYLYGAVIGYNTARTPGLGSAIFLHVSHVGATSGCVSIPENELLAVLRWLDPAQHPRIVMGTTAAVTR